MWNSPKFLNQLFLTILSRLWSPLWHLFYHVFSPANFPINMYPYSTVWTASFFSRDLLWSTLLLEGSAVFSRVVAVCTELHREIHGRDGQYELKLKSSIFYRLGGEYWVFPFFSCFRKSSLSLTSTYSSGRHFGLKHVRPGSSYFVCWVHTTDLKPSLSLRFEWAPCP